MEELVAALGIDDVRQIVRTGEDAYAQLGLADARQDELIDAIVDNPILLQRPILVRGDHAVVGRPPEAITSLL